MIKFKSQTNDEEFINSVFSSFNFPAGEAHTKLTTDRELNPEDRQIAILQFEPDSIHEDLFQLGVWNETVFRYAPDADRVAVIPYFPAARADRGNHFDLEVYADFVSNMGLTRVVVFDPHSQVTPRRLSASTSADFIYPSELFAEAHIKPLLGNYTGIIAPDAGAGLRAQGVANVEGLPLYTATKERNPETGKLSNFQIEDLPKDGQYLVIDDICDGGGTFIGLAEATGLPKEQLDLYVSHGVFSGLALSNLPKAFGHVFTTNSYNPTRKLNVYTTTSTFIRFDIIHQLIKKTED